MKLASYIPVALAIAFIIPSTSLAASTSVNQVTAASLGAQLSQLHAELSSTTTPGTATFSLTPGQSILQASTTATGGVLKLSLPALEHTNPDPTVPAIVAQHITYLAQLTLQYMPCEAASPSVCISEASSSYPAMRSDLAQGQDTGYLHYLVTLTNLSSTTATIQVTDSSFLSTLQTQLNSISTQVHALLGS